MALSAKQRAFIEYYLTHWNAAQAAREAGYSGNTSGQLGYQLLQNPSIVKEIEGRLSALHMSADEVLTRLSAQARTSFADLLTINTESGTWELDLNKAQQTGAIHAIKKLRAGKYGPEIELYDAQAALALLGKHHSLFVERHEHSGPDGAAIQIEDARDHLADRLARFAASPDTSADSESDSRPASAGSRDAAL